MRKTVFILLMALCALTACNNEKTEKLTIASEMADCVGVAPMKCLLIKEEGKNEWEYFYGTIEGFNYVPGFEYVIEVKKEEIKNPAADQSSIKYIFVKEISKLLKDSDVWI